jgi:hypothetical protein
MCKLMLKKYLKNKKAFASRIIKYNAKDYKKNFFVLWSMQFLINNSIVGVIKKNIFPLKKILVFL